MIIDIISFWLVVAAVGLGGIALLAMVFMMLSSMPVLGQYIKIDEVYDNNFVAALFFPLRIALNLSIFALPLYVIYLLFSQMVSVSVIAILDGRLDRQHYYGYATNSLHSMAGAVTKFGLTSRGTEELDHMSDEQFDAIINKVDKSETGLYGTLLINQTGAPLFHSRIYYYNTNTFEDIVLAMDTADIKAGSQEENILKKITRLRDAMAENDVSIANDGYFITEMPHRTYVGCAEKTPANFIFDGNDSVANESINQYVVQLTEVTAEDCP